MTTYELMLTDQCNRDCSFCWVQRGSYIISKAEAEDFIAQVRSLEKSSRSKHFTISFFGGEPLLAVERVQQVQDAFSQDTRCLLNMTTNGDLASSDVIQKLQNIFWHISTYDFMKDPDRYAELASQLRKKSFQFTFTEDTIDYADDFRQFARSIGVQYKTTFSHSRASWRGLSSFELHDIAEETMMRELEDILYDPFEVPIQSILADHYLRILLGSIARKMKTGSFQTDFCPTCLDSQKKIFLKGEFIKSCLRFIDLPPPQSCFKDCQVCDYFNVCSKSCIAELDDDGKVDSKLCALEHGCFDAVCAFAEAHQCDRVWRDKVLRQYIQES